MTSKVKRVKWGDPVTSKVKRVKWYDGTTRVQLMLDGEKYIEIIPGERLTYLWVGDDKTFYSATRPPSKQALREFAKELIKAVNA